MLLYWYGCLLKLSQHYANGNVKICKAEWSKKPPLNIFDVLTNIVYPAQSETTFPTGDGFFSRDTGKIPYLRSSGLNSHKDAPFILTNKTSEESSVRKSLLLNSNLVLRRQYMIRSMKLSRRRRSKNFAPPWKIVVYIGETGVICTPRGKTTFLTFFCTFSAVFPEYLLQRM